MRRMLFFICMLVCWKTGAQIPFFKELMVGENEQPLAVNTLIQDQRGYLLLGTVAGLYQFNGRDFTLITGDTQPVTAIACRGAKCYIGYKNGRIGVLKNGQLLTLTDGQEHSQVNSIVPVNDSTILICTESQGILTYSGGKVVRRISAAEGLADDYVYEATQLDGADAFVAATDGGISIISKTTKPSTIATASGLTDNIVRTVCYDGERQQLIAGTQQGGLCCISIKPADFGKVLYTTQNWRSL